MKFRVRIEAERVFFDTREMSAEARRMAQHASRRIKARIKRKSSASAPGQPPAGKSGTLRRSIGYKKVSGGGVGFWVGARSGGGSNRDGFYGRFLQLGTEKLESRDFVDGTIDAERGFIERSLADAAARAVGVKT